MCGEVRQCNRKVGIMDFIGLYSACVFYNIYTCIIPGVSQACYRKLIVIFIYFPLHASTACGHQQLKHKYIVAKTYIDYLSGKNIMPYEKVK
jgi:hypothetical protein